MSAYVFIKGTKRVMGLDRPYLALWTYRDGRAPDRLHEAIDLYSKDNVATVISDGTCNEWEAVKLNARKQLGIQED